MNNIITIAVDGTSGSGKGTISKALAHHFGFSYLDTGILFRATALIDPKLEFIFDLSSKDFLEKIEKLKDEDLRSNENGIRASEIATDLKLREKLMHIERDFAFSSSAKGSVLDGRDIGSVILPDATCKIFITASIETRAKRRFATLKETNENITYEKVLESLKLRDIQDSTRKIAPLKFDESYVLIDTTDDTIEQSLRKAIEIVKKSIS